jgi:outer membrane immunogenic protein
MLPRAKSVVFGLAAMAIATTAAQADGMPPRSYAGAAPFSWTGFYIGASGGYAWGESTWTDLGGLGANVKFDDLKGGIGGGQLGYNLQTGPWVLGVEGTITSGIDQTGIVLGTTLGTDVRWMATAVGRVGYAWGRTMGYVKGGYATANIEITGNNGIATFSSREQHNGWTIGGGWEYAFTKNLSLGVEYNYYDFGSERHNTVPVPVGGPISVNEDTRVSSVLARLNFKFDDDRRYAPLK